MEGSEYFMARQGVYLLLITKLVYLHHVIEMIEKNPSIIDEQIFGEGLNGFLNYLSYSQFNGNATKSVTVMNYLLSNNYCLVEKEKLANFTTLLIEMLFTKVSNLYPNLSNKFFICIDEANLYAQFNTEYNERIYKDLKGQDVGYLTLMAEEFALFANSNNQYSKQFHFIFAGTLNLFSNDIFKLNQSAISKTEATIGIAQIVTNSELTQDEFFKFISLHINLSNEEVELLEKIHVNHPIFPLRRRFATFAIEILMDRTNLLGLDDEKLNSFGLSFTEEELKAKHKFIWALLVSISISSNQIKKEIKRQFSDLDITSKGLIKDALIQYITHFTHSNYLGDTFRVKLTNDIANRFVSSGLFTPTQFNSETSMITYKANDSVSFIQAKYWFGEWFGSESLQDISYHILSLSNTSSYESIFALTFYLESLKKTSISKLPFFYGKTVNSLIKDQVFNCKTIMNGLNYYDKCVRLNWVSSSSSLSNEKKMIEGELLYFTHIANKEWNRVNGILMKLSKNCHADYFIVNHSFENETPYYISCSVRNNSSEKNLNTGSKGLKSTLPQLFYVKNLEKITTSIVKNEILENKVWKLPSEINVTTTEEKWLKIRKNVLLSLSKMVPIYLVNHFHPQKELKGNIRNESIYYTSESCVSNRIQNNFNCFNSIDN